MKRVIVGEDDMPTLMSEDGRVDTSSILDTSTVTPVTTMKAPAIKAAKSGMANGGTRAVASYQKTLNNLGYKIDVDGAWGNQTQGAFERAIKEGKVNRDGTLAGVKSSTPSRSMKAPVGRTPVAPAASKSVVGTATSTAKTSAAQSTTRGRAMVNPMKDTVAVNDGTASTVNVAQREAGRKAGNKFQERIAKAGDDVDDIVKGLPSYKEIKEFGGKRMPGYGGEDSAVPESYRVTKKDYQDYMAEKDANSGVTGIGRRLGAFAGGVASAIPGGKMMKTAIAGAPIAYNAYQGYKDDAADGDVNYAERAGALGADVVATAIGSALGGVGKGAIKGKMANTTARANAARSGASVLPAKVTVGGALKSSAKATVEKATDAIPGVKTVKGMVRNSRDIAAAEKRILDADTDKVQKALGKMETRNTPKPTATKDPTAASVKKRGASSTQVNNRENDEVLSKIRAGAKEKMKNSSTVNAAKEKMYLEQEAADVAKKAKQAASKPNARKMSNVRTTQRLRVESSVAAKKEAVAALDKQRGTAMKRRDQLAKGRETQRTKKEEAELNRLIAQEEAAKPKATSTTMKKPEKSMSAAEKAGIERARDRKIEKQILAEEKAARKLQDQYTPKAPKVTEKARPSKRGRRMKRS